MNHAEERRPWVERIQVGGFVPFSTIDWPDRLAAVVFLRGCPWRCGYCHNAHLQTRTGPAPIAWETVIAQLERRRGWLDGVVFSGGEPTADRTLPDAIANVRALGFKVALHTGGAYPDRLEALLPQLDWVGFDLKTTFARYDALTGTPGSGGHAARSARLLAASSVPHEFRLTYHHQLIDADTALDAAHAAAQLGVQRFALQAYRPEGCADTTLSRHAGLPEDLFAQIAPLFPHFSFRPAH